MNTRPILLSAIGLLALAAPADAQSRPDSRTFSDKYGVIVDRNIFSRSRSQPSARGDRPRFESSSRGSQPRYVLTGVLLQEESNQYIAFIEDLSARSTSRLQVGASLGLGKITRVSIDGIDFEASGKQAHIDIGMGIDGAAPSIASTGPASTQPSAVEAPTLPPLGEGGDMMERLRQRRLREMGK